MLMIIRALRTRLEKLVMQPERHVIEPELHDVEPVLHDIEPVLHDIEPERHVIEPGLHDVEPECHDVEPVVLMMPPGLFAHDTHIGDQGKQVRTGVSPGRQSQSVCRGGLMLEIEVTV
jgi:hypothetical protein